ncbi:MAG: periplasmic protein TonB [Pyrinomonadaceae bacterium]|nr:periplasmic protein TonB [Pyrinomonadaceae bacterium]
MRRLFFTSMIFVALSVATALAAQQKEITVRWHRLTPEKEAFSVLMPEPPLRVRRVIPFSEELQLTTPVYEVTHRGVLFSVLSIDKKAVASLKTPEAFAAGLRHAIRRSSHATDNEVTFNSEVISNGQPAKQYVVRAEGNEGTAQVYETKSHYYVLMTLGARASDLLARNFFISFTLGAKREADASDMVSIIQDGSPSRTAPEPLWPVAGSKSVAGKVAESAGPVGPIGRVVSGPTAAPSDAGTPSPKISGGGVLNGKASSKPQPSYPPVAQAARAQGTVVVQITVDEEGYVISARAISGHPLLQQAAVQAARQARFAPTRLSGKPVKVTGVVTYNFVLAPDPAEPPTRKY